jgi:transposase-like protein
MRFQNRSIQGWHPPHCPSPNCIHHKQFPNSFTIKKSGYFKRFVDGRRLESFTCKTCGVTFSSQTFSTTYWQKRPDLDKKIFMKTVGGMANRQIARDLAVAPCTIDRHIQRIARHCLLFHHLAMQGAKPPHEIVIDGFESFEFSQYFPIHHHLAIEKETGFFLHFTDSPLRRKGRMTRQQKLRRFALEEEFGRPDPKAIGKDVKHLLDVVLNGQCSAIVHSDDHKSYLRSIRETPCRIRHIVTSGKLHRDRHNRLWEVNFFDMMIRHSIANHRRETISFSKRRQGSAERLVIFLVWMNYIKRSKEKDRNSPSAAMLCGIYDRRLGVEDVLDGRLFRGHVELPDRWSEYYDRSVQTPALGRNCRHELSYGR